MLANEILEEARKLHKVSKRLDALARENAPVAEGIAILAESIRRSATLLEVLVALRLGLKLGLDTTAN